MIKKLLSSRLRINMVSGVATHGINFIVLAAAYPVYLHYLGYDTYGLWLALGTVLAFAQLGELGISQAVMKLVAEEHGRGDIKAIERLVTTAITILLISGSVTLGIILFFKTSIIGLFRFNEENAQLAAWLLPYIGVLSVYVLAIQALNATLSGLGRMDLANYVQTGGRFVALGVAIVLLLGGRGIESLLIGGIVSYVTMHTMDVFFIHRIAPVRFIRRNNLDVSSGKKLLSFGTNILGASIVSMIGIPFNKIILSRYAGVDTLPIFEIAFRGARQLRSVAEMGFRALMPEISRVTGELSVAGCERIRHIYHQSMRLNFLFALPLYTILFLFAHPLLNMWLRDSFKEAITLPFQLLLIATFISLLAVPAYYLLMGMGEVRSIFIASCINWMSDGVFVVMILLCLNKFSPSLAGGCLVASWSLSSVYLIGRFYFVMRRYEINKEKHYVQEPSNIKL